MKNILTTIEEHGKQLIADEKLRNVLVEAQLAAAVEDEGNEENGGKKLHIQNVGIEDDNSNNLAGYNYTIHRSRLLLLRSAISTISTIMTDLASFSHPYILRTLSATLALRCINMSIRKKSDNEQAKLIDTSSDTKKSKLQKKKKKILSGSNSDLKVKISSKEDAIKQAAEIHVGEVRSLCDDIGKLNDKKPLILLIILICYNKLNLKLIFMNAFKVFE